MILSNLGFEINSLTDYNAPGEYSSLNEQIFGAICPYSPAIRIRIINEVMFLYQLLQRVPCIIPSGHQAQASNEDSFRSVACDDFKYVSYASSRVQASNQDETSTERCHRIHSKTLTLAISTSLAFITVIDQSVDLLILLTIAIL